MNIFLKQCEWKIKFGHNLDAEPLPSWLLSIVFESFNRNFCIKLMNLKDTEVSKIKMVNRLPFDYGKLMIILFYKTCCFVISDTLLPYSLKYVKKIAHSLSLCKSACASYALLVIFVKKGNSSKIRKQFFTSDRLCQSYCTYKKSIILFFNQRDQNRK